MLHFRIKNEITRLSEDILVQETDKIVVSGYKFVADNFLYCHLLFSDGTTSLLFSGSAPSIPIGKQLNYVSWVKIPDVHKDDIIIDLNSDIQEMRIRLE